MMHDLAQHVRHAFRLLLRTPAFTLPAIASLALGIGVNTTVFSVFSAALLRPLGAGGHDLVRIYRSAPGMREFRSATYEELGFVRRQAASFTRVAGHQIESVHVTFADRPVPVSAEIVAGDYFGVLGVQPAVGRAFTAEEDAAAGAVPVIVISDRLRRRSFLADRAVTGRTVLIGNRAFTIIGVAPAHFHGAFPGVATDLWRPASMAHLVRPSAETPPSLMLIAQLAPGVSPAAARAELALLARRMAREGIARDANHEFVLAGARGVHPSVARPLRMLLLLILAVVGAVLLIACANVASLLLARAHARRGELAIRLALGATRARITIQLLVENLVLAGLAGTAGLLLAIWPVQLLNAVSPMPGPTGSAIFFDLRVDARVLTFTVIVTVFTVVVFGLLPAVQASRVGVLGALKEGRALNRARLRNVLVAIQVGLCFLLLVVAGLLFRSVRNAGQMDVGFDPDRVVVASFDFAPGIDRAATQAFHTDLLDRMRGVPGVERAALASFVALGDRRGHPWPVAVHGTTPRAGEDHVRVPVGIVSDDYFATVRQPLLRGRAFAAHDRADARVVIVNEALTRRFWPGADALGRRIGLGEDLAEHEVVGIAKDARFASFGGDIQPFVYLPSAGDGWLHIRVRGSYDGAQVLAELTRLAHELDPRAPPPNGRTMRDAMAAALLPARLGRAVFGIAGVIALLLAAGGLYGLVYYTLEQRMKEIGIRVALGATRRGVFRVIVGRAVRFAAIGVALGASVAAATTRLMSALLYGLSPTDPLTFGGIAALLLLVTLGAGYVAARKGLAVDPIVVLRHD